jgi:two-component system, cell cycle sensor histidine kinase and response regulator CckA
MGVSMNGDNQPQPDLVFNGESVPDFLPSGHELTETIDLSTLFSEAVPQTPTEDLRREQYASFGKLLEAISVPTLLIARTHIVTFANTAFRRIIKEPPRLGKVAFASLFSSPSEVQRAELILEKVFVDRKPIVQERMLDLCGAKLWGRIQIRALRLSGEQMALVQIENLTAQKELLAVQKYRKLVNLFPIGIAEFSCKEPCDCRLGPEVRMEAIRGAVVVDGNDEFARVYKRPDVRELFGFRLGRLFPLEGKGRTVFESWIKRRFPICSFTTRETASSSPLSHFENTLIANVTDRHLLGFWWLRRDISDKKRTEEEVLRVHKLESLGILAGGIAHDFNNLLTAVLGNLSLASACMEVHDRAYEKIVLAMKATQRSQELTRQLLTFSKGGAPIRKSACIDELLHDCADFVLRGSNIRTQYIVPEDLWHVQMDGGQIGQVVNNLILNAVQAMPQGGIIWVRALNQLVSPHSKIPLQKGRYVRISVTDTGSGIPSENLGKVFDPYFTTKEKGTGLGLAISYSIVRKHGGYISVKSKEGVGSTFYFYLPASLDKPEQTSPLQSVAIPGTGKILVMDDEEMIREMLEDLLTGLGYEVAFARDGIEAVNLYRAATESRHPFDLAIVDLTIPGGMGGKEAVQRILELDPEARCIVSSGHCADPIMSQYEQYGFKGVLPKPYDAMQLSAEVARVMKRKE